MESRLKRGDLARLGGIHPESVRFYERQGLLPRPPRSAAGYRLFDAESIERVQFIKRAQELGFSLSEIRELLSLRMEDCPCAEMRRRAQGKLSDIRGKIRDLKRMQRTLEKLTGQCPGSGDAECCPILVSLRTGSWQNRARRNGNGRKEKAT